ncbi:MAG: KilA-N domain-containing protein [Bacteroidota bacterium]
MSKQSISIEGKEIAIIQVNGEDYISLTDMVKPHKRPDEVIRNWLRTRSTLNFIGTWEKLYNSSFKPVEFDGLMRYAGDASFTMSVKEWGEVTGGIGIYSKRGRNGGTYAHKDIAFKFGASISALFELLLIKDYQRLKEQESSGWSYQRFLTKVNYRLHTDTIRDVILPALQTPKNKEWLVYADEADLLNMAVFGLTAKEWREQNPELARKGNIRDFADIVSLNVLANVEAMNAFYIEKGVAKEKRFALLKEASIKQYERLIARSNDKRIE